MKKLWQLCACAAGVLAAMACGAWAVTSCPSACRSCSASALPGWPGRLPRACAACRAGWLLFSA